MRDREALAIIEVNKEIVYVDVSKQKTKILRTKNRTRKLKA